MIKRLESKVKAMLDDRLEDFTENEEIQNNPLIAYLKIYQKQHRIVFTLYRGLIVSFSGFLFLVSFLIFTSLESGLVPTWGAFLLGAIDLVLLAGLIKSLRELRNYRAKSYQIIHQIYDHLKADLLTLYKLQSHQAKASSSQQQLLDPFKSFSAGKTATRQAVHRGWDATTCPSCSATIEMSLDQCPHCQFKIGPPVVN